jgi:hypothetical protein
MRFASLLTLKNLHGALDFVYTKNFTNNIFTAVFEDKPKSPAGASYVHQVGDMLLFGNLFTYTIAKWWAG